jgi:hypothetical protein
MLWITTSQTPLVAIPNWCREKCLQRHCEIESLAQLMNEYNTSPMAMGWIPLEGLVMVKKWAAPRTCVIRYGM